MATRAALQKQILDSVGRARAIAAKAEAEGRSFNDTERNEVKSHMDAAAGFKNEIAALDADGEMMKSLNGLGLEYGSTITGGTDGAFAEKNAKSLGKKFTDAEAMKAWFENTNLTKSGHISRETRVNSPAIQFDGVKDILATGGGASQAGLLVNPDQRGLIEDGTVLQRPLTIRNLVTNGSTNSDVVNFVRVAGFTNGATPVPEAQGAEPYVAGAGQVRGLKPQSSLVLEEDSTNVVTIAHWNPVSKRALSDAAQLRTLIDNFLRYGLEEELEDQMVNGSGTGENFEGILNAVGTSAQPWDTNLLTTTRKAKTKVRTLGRATATAYVFNPADNERFDLLTNGNGDFIFGAPTGNQVQTLWGLPRIESEAIPEGTGLVADFRQAVLYDREQAAIQLTDSHADFFIRNLVAILAELRAAFVLLRPKAFVEIDLTA